MLFRSGKEVKEGIIHYLDTNTKRKVVINPFLKEEVKEIKRKVVKMLECNIIPERVDNENKCNKCGLRDKCYSDEIMVSLLKEKQKL